jgi:hypothetical protein
MTGDPTHPLQPKPEQPQRRLEPTLEEVREQTSIGEAETAELMQIEEALSYANEMAKQAIPPRPRNDADGGAPPPS